MKRLILFVFVNLIPILLYGQNSDPKLDSVLSINNIKYNIVIDAGGSELDLYDYSTNNAILKIVRMSDMTQIINDSIGSMGPDFELADFNNDGLDDLLVYRCHGARANTFYYLQSYIPHRQ